MIKIRNLSRAATITTAHGTAFLGAINRTVSAAAGITPASYDKEEDNLGVTPDVAWFKVANIQGTPTAIEIQRLGLFGYRPGDDRQRVRNHLKLIADPMAAYGFGFEHVTAGIIDGIPHAVENRRCAKSGIRGHGARTTSLDRRLYARVRRKIARDAKAA